MSAKAEESALPMKEMLKPTGFIAPASVADKTFAEATEGSGGEGLKYHLYAWDCASGTAIAYSEKEVPVAGDVVFLKEGMEGGKITDTAQLKLVYHVVSDADGKITVSEHPEGSTGGYVFNRNAEDDYEEEITDIRDVIDITQNSLTVTQKGTAFKAVQVGASQWYRANTPPVLTIRSDGATLEGVSINPNYLVPLEALTPESSVELYEIWVDLTKGHIIGYSIDTGSDEIPVEDEGTWWSRTDQFACCLAMFDCDEDWSVMKDYNMNQINSHRITPLVPVQVTVY